MLLKLEILWNKGDIKVSIYLPRNSQNIFYFKTFLIVENFGKINGIL